MILFSIGLPSRFAELCDALILRLAQHCFGAVASVALNSLEELATAVIRSRTTNVVVCCRQPVPRLQHEIAQADLPFVVTLDDPCAALHHLVDRAGYSLAEATRAVASSCAAMLTTTTAAGALVLKPAEAANLLALAAAIVRHFELPIDDSALLDIVDCHPDAGSELTDTDLRAWLDQLSDRDRAIVNGALGSYIAHFTGGDLEALVWEPELFYIGEEPTSPIPTPAARPVDLTGRPRFVVFGPYINLAPGPWMADIVLGFSAEAAGMAFSIEVFCGTQLAHTHITVTGEEVNETRLHFTIGDHVDHPVQIRIQSERAAFDGRLAIGYVAVTPQAAVSEETRTRLANSLRR